MSSSEDMRPASAVSGGASPGSQPEPVHARVLVPVLVFLGMVVAVVSSLGAPLIPTIARVDHVSLAAAQWSLTITLLVGAVATPTMGRLGDGPRRREVILASLVSVVIGSALAALPLGYGTLIVGRALQGAGLGLTPLAIAVARDALPAPRVRPVTALLSVTTVAGVGLGYPITGLIAQYLGVAAGFWFGAAVGALGLAAAAVVIPSSRHRPGRRLDTPGALLLGLALAGTLVALAQSTQWGWSSPVFLAVIVASAVLAAAWVGRQFHCGHPLVNLRLLASRGVLTADAAALLVGLVMYLLVSSVTRFVQTPVSAGYGFGSSIVVTGLVLLPFSMASLLGNRLTPTLTRRFSPRSVMPIAALVLFASLAMFTGVRSHVWQVVVAMAIAGAGVGATFATLPGLVVQSVPPDETSSAMGFNQVLRYVGYSAGSALSAAVLAARTPARHMLPLAGGYRLVGLVGCAGALLALVGAMVIPGRAGRAPAPVATAAGAAGSDPITLAEVALADGFSDDSPDR